MAVFEYPELQKSEFPQRSAWGVKTVGVRERTAGTSGTSSAATFKAAVECGATMADLDASELAAAGYETDDVIASFEFLGSPFTRRVARDWRLVVDGETWTVKRITRATPYLIVAEAQRSA